MNHRIVDSNGIKMHLAEDGEGPLVVLCHGFPELWYSWRHQLKALAEAGYHAVAPDQRGYGQTDRPEAVEGSGDAPPDKRWRFLFDKSETFLDTGTVPEVLPAWLTEADLDFYTEQFKRTGFRGGLNWYRNIDRNWELTAFSSGAKIRQPSLFIAGEFDAVIAMYRQAFDSLEETMPGLRKKVLVPGAGHWIQQERPIEVNDLLIEFLASL
jgi:pimeloyl-ACP methyl ester carboxylesterase